MGRGAACVPLGDYLAPFLQPRAAQSWCDEWHQEIALASAYCMGSRMLALRPRRIEAHVTALVCVVHLANAVIAAWIGYLSPDSWYYLRLANTFFVNGYPRSEERRVGKECSSRWARSQQRQT